MYACIIYMHIYAYKYIYTCTRYVCDCVVVSVLDCQLRGPRLISPPEQKFVLNEDYCHYFIVSIVLLIIYFIIIIIIITICVINISVNSIIISISIVEISRRVG